MNNLENTVSTATELEILAPGTAVVFPAMQTCQIADDDELIELWLRPYDNRNTRAKYKAAACRLTQALVHGIRGAGLPEMARYEDGLKKYLQPRSVQGEMAVLGSLFGFAQRAGYIERSPVHVYRRRKTFVRRKPKALAEDTIKLLLSGASSQRDRVLIEFLFAAGARAVEVGRCPDPDNPGEMRNALTWGQITLEGGHAIVTLLGKGSKWRTIKLAPGITGRLMALKPSDATDDDAVFSGTTDDERPYRGMHYTSILSIVKEARGNAGISRNITPHMLRHSHATIAEQRGKKLSEIRDSLGHASIETTMLYIAERDGVMIGDVFSTDNGD